MLVSDAPELPPPNAIEALPLPVFAVSRSYQLSALNSAAMLLMESGQVFRRSVLSPETPEGALLCPLIDMGFASGSLVQREIAWPNSPLEASLWFAPFGERLLLALSLQPSGQARSAASESAALMAAMLAHEIRNPLLAISGAAQLLAGAGAKPELCDLISREAARIERLLKDIDPLRGAPDAVRAPVNIHALLDQSVASVAAAVAPHVKVTRLFDPSLPDVMGDTDSLGRVFTNLIKNAAEACQNAAQPEITLTTRYHLAGGSRALAVEVADNGPGIPDDTAAQLFRPFVSTKQGGRGLGLAIALRGAEDNGGTLTLTSRKRGSTRFQLLLPLG